MFEVWRFFAAVAVVVRMGRIEAAVGSYLASGKGEREQERGEWWKCTQHNRGKRSS